MNTAYPSSLKGQVVSAGHVIIKIHVFRIEQQRKDLFGRIAELEERLSIARNESAREKLDSVEARSNLAKVTDQLEKLQKESIKDHKFLKKQLR